MTNIDITLLITTTISFLGAIVSNVAWSVKTNKKTGNKILEMLEKQVNNLTEENIQLRNKVDRLQEQLIELTRMKGH